jgi:Tfp pilus assembly protein PilO
MKLTARDRVLVGVIAVLALCAAFYMLLITPQRHQASHLQAQIGAARTTLARAQRRELVGSAAEAALKASQVDWSATQRAVPRTADVPALLKLLTRSARAAHVSMQSISLSSSATGTGSTPLAGGTTSATGAINSVAGAVTIPVSLTFNGGYQALNRLVGRLDALVTTSPRTIRSRGPLIGIGNISLAPISSSAHSSKLSVQLTATIYQRSGASATTTGATG